MKAAAVELADPGIVVVTEDGLAAGPSPGIALLDGGTPVVGVAAAARRRLQPRQIHDQYWEQLDSRPLARPHPDHLTTADLAFAQLVELFSELHRKVEVVLVAAPATFDRQRLGLLLGIAEAASIPIRGLVDSAVAAAVTRPLAPGPVIHVDLLLHRVVVTALAVGHEVSRLGFETEQRIGLLGLRDLLARAVASQFVRATRFDPLKLAVTEQQLFDRLPDLVNEIGLVPSVRLRMAAGGREYEVELTRPTFEDACRDEVARIESLVSRCGEDRDFTVLLTHRAAAIPGLERRFGERWPERVARIDPLSAAGGALAAATDIIPESGEMRFVSRLPLRSGESAAAPAEEPRRRGSAGAVATHVLYLGRAYPITAEPLMVGTSGGGAGRRLIISGTVAGVSPTHCSLVSKDGRAVVENHGTQGSYLNGSRIEKRAELVSGDHLRLGTAGVELQAISVED